MTEIQQGANSAMAPATTAASTDPPRRCYYSSRITTFMKRHALPCECIPAAHAAVLLPGSASLRGRAGHRFRLGDDRCLRAFHLGDLASEGFLLRLKS